MAKDISIIRQEEAFYHMNHYKKYQLDSKNSWLGYPIKDLVELGVSISKQTKKGRFLDLGSGVGRNSIPIVQKSFDSHLRIDCVDILPMAIEKLSLYATKLGIQESIDLFISDIAMFNMLKKSYDYVFSVSALEHLDGKEQLISVLESIRESVKYRGYVYLVVNSNIKEFSHKKERNIDPFIEINLSSIDMLQLLNRVFKDWNLVKEDNKCLSFPIERSNEKTEMTTNAITYVAQKIVR